MLAIKYTKLSIQDLNNGYTYILTENPQTARFVIDRIEQTISKLAEFPHIGHNGRVQNTCEFVVLGTPFIIIYRYDSETLKIISILHSSRRYP